MSTRRKVVVLLSGGMDSVTALYDACASHDVVAALSFDYGAKHNARELPFARAHADRLGVPHQTLPLGFIGETFKSALLKGGAPIPKGHYEEETMKQTVVPFRNGIMLAIAAGFAESQEADALVIAAHAGDHAIYPDCREDFMRAMAEAIKAGTYAGVEVLRPFIFLGKAQIARRGAELGVDYAQTWSCYVGEQVHCGECGTCVERREAFLMAGLPDPTVYLSQTALPARPTGAGGAVDCESWREITTMWVSEIFYSVQGEGELTGVPSVFIRLAGCNLRCAWCDTKYASWEPEGTHIGLEELVAQVNSFPAAHVVITGGEPMIAREIGQLASMLKDAGKHITIETAGTVRPGGIMCDLASLSPKLSGSTPSSTEISPEWVERHERTRLQPEVLQEWITGYTYQLKFVVAERKDVDEIQDLLARIGVPIPPHKVLLMPEGTDVATLNSRREMLIDVCKEKGFRYCDRLHVALFGHRRGT